MPTPTPCLTRKDDLVSSTDEPSDEGATAVEYGLLLALIAAVIAGAMALLGTAVLNALAGMVGRF